MKQRVLTAFVLIPIVLAAVAWTSPIGVWILAAAAAAIAITEGGRLLGSPFPGYLTGALALVLCPPLTTPRHEVAGFLAGLTLAALLGAAIVAVALRRPARLNRETASAGAGLWCAAPLAAVVYLHQLGNSSAVWQIENPVLELLLPLWAGDTAAYYVGKAWGKHLLAPKISPKKTREGAVANLLAAVAVAIPIGLWLGYAWPVGLGCGVAIGILGQMGDLFESHIKRAAEVKDSGTLLPGHGGLLDRIDSLLFAAPVVALILSLYR